MKTQHRIHSPFSPWLGVTLLLAALLPNAESQAQVTLTLKGSYSEPGYGGYFVEVKGTYAYVSVHGNGTVTPDWGLLVIDVSDPTQPRRVGFYETSSGSWFWMSGNYAYLATFAGFSPAGWVPDGLVVLDIKEPAQPRPVGSYPLDGYYPNVDVVGSYAYVWQSNGSGDLGSSLQVVDVNDPANPVKVGSYETTSGVSGLRVVGKYAYLCHGYDHHGLEIIDVSDPVNPRPVGRDDGVNCGGVQVVGNFAYLSVYAVLPRAYSLHVMDVSDPSKPVRVGAYPADGLRDVRVVGHYAYLTRVEGIGSLEGARSLLDVIDVTDPRHPVFAGRYRARPRSDFGDFDVIGDMVYLANLEDGERVLVILEAQFPFRFNPPLRSGDKLRLSWDGAPGIKLQTTPSLTAPNWQDVPGTDGASSVELPLTDPSAFFRLIKP
ncbi:MAG: hypothetical protein HYY24_12365 [Verrucomicrobia bacterium]|nr:hypothetical protein [Verrucomicrobiota bacterium]